MREHKWTIERSKSNVHTALFNTITNKRGALNESVCCRVFIFTTPASTSTGVKEIPSRTLSSLLQRVSPKKTTGDGPSIMALPITDDRKILVNRIPLTLAPCSISSDGIDFGYFVFF